MKNEAFDGYRSIIRSARAIIHFEFSIFDLIAAFWTVVWLLVKLPTYLIAGKARMRRFGWTVIVPLEPLESAARRLRLNRLMLVSNTPFGKLRWRPFTSDIFVLGHSHEPTVTKFFLKEAYAVKTFIDVGSHIGRYALLVSRNKSCEILAVEPDEENFNLLVNNIQLNRCTNVTPINAALYDHDGYMILLKEGANMGYRIKDTNEYKRRAYGAPVRVYALKSLMDATGFHAVDLVKLDTEGAELRIVYSSREIMDRIARWIIEVHNPARSEEIETFFRQHGYDTEWLDGEHLFAVRKEGSHP